MIMKMFATIKEKEKWKLDTNQDTCDSVSTPKTNSWETTNPWKVCRTRLKEIPIESKFSKGFTGQHPSNHATFHQKTMFYNTMLHYCIIKRVPNQNKIN